MTTVYLQNKKIENVETLSNYALKKLYDEILQRLEVEKSIASKENEKTIERYTKAFNIVASILKKH